MALKLNVQLDQDLNKEAEMYGKTFWKRSSATYKSAGIKFNNKIYRGAHKLTEQWGNYFKMLYMKLFTFLN